MVKLHPRQSGFTLLEVLVAISILAIIAILGWQSLSNIMRSRERIVQDMTQARGLQLSFAQLQSDCEHSALNYELNGRPMMSVEAQRLVLVRTVLNDTHPVSLQVVAYRVQEGALLRSESIATRDLRQLDMIWRATLADTDKAPSVKLYQGVTQMQVQLWYTDGAWRTTLGEIASVPASSQGATLGPAPPVSPTGLQVALQLQGREGNMTKNFLLGTI